MTSARFSAEAAAPWGARRRVAAPLIRALRHLEPLRVRGLLRLLSLVSPLVLGRGLGPLPTTSGFILWVDPGQYFDCMMIHGRYSPEVVAALRAVVRPGQAVVDVGAQIGYLTNYLATMVGPAGRVFAVEPDPQALDRLRASVARNERAWIEVIDVAASDQDGSITLNVSPTVGWSTVVEGSHHRDITPVQVRAARLDTLARAGRLRRPIALMKLDAEGHEAAVLDGAAELVSEDRPYLLIELNRLMLEPAGETPASVLERVVRNDRYDVFELRAPRGLLSGRRFELFSLADWHAVEFMDVLCVPRERGLPQQ